MTVTFTTRMLREILRDGLFVDGDWVESKDQDPGGTVRLTQLADVGETVWRDRSDRWMNEEQARRLRITYLQPDDVLIARMPDPLGRACLVPESIGPAATVVDVAILRPSEHSTDSRYLMYAVNSHPVRSQIDLLQAGATRQRISRKNLGGIRVPLPPLDEQRDIADFLDQETARIDALVAKQEEFIGLLRERRSAEITRAVTTGLSPGGNGRAVTSNEKRRVTHPLGGWHSIAPSGWSHARVKSVSRNLTDGAHISPETDGGTFAFVSTRDLDNGYINFEECLKTSPRTYEYMVRTGCKPRQGDVLFSKDGTIGVTAVVSQDRDFVVASSLIIISPDRHIVLSQFLNYAFSARPVMEQARMFARGAGLPRISVANLGRIELPIPPIADQKHIVRHLDRQTTRIDTLIAKAEEHIALAKERRSALITAAVTGQFDVRTASRKAS